MDLEIYNMTISDLELIAPILQTEYDDFWSASILKLELENNNSKYIVAKQNNEILGFAGIWISIDDIHITNIVTKKNKRNQGVGSLLLEHLIILSKNTNLASLTLEVNEQNKLAIHLYEKYGFKTIGIRKKYYNNKDNAIIMTKDLRI